MGKNPSHFKGDARLPVENVDWFAAVEFCNRLSEKEGFQAYYRIEGSRVAVIGGDGYRLPTEAEWEYACRAGTSTKWCCGDTSDDLGRYAWFAENSGGKTHPVGQKEPNAWGLHDMHGNVWEWCDTWYHQSAAQSEDPNYLGSARVLRGGSWGSSAGSARSAFRSGGQPSSSDDLVGFRVARALR
jgi:formylglycine-generating enzyme required for sulfatase activity